MSAGDPADARKQLTTLQVKYRTRVEGVLAKLRRRGEINQLEFSELAVTRYGSLVEHYIDQLQQTSRQKAAVNLNDNVSQKHVSEAASFLLSGPDSSRWKRFCEAFGGILFGAGIPEAISAATQQGHSATHVALAMALLPVGSLMLGVFLRS